MTKINFFQCHILKHRTNNPHVHRMFFLLFRSLAKKQHDTLLISITTKTHWGHTFLLHLSGWIANSEIQCSWFSLYDSSFGAQDDVTCPTSMEADSATTWGLQLLKKRCSEYLNALDSIFTHALLYSISCTMVTPHLQHGTVYASIFAHLK